MSDREPFAGFPGIARATAIPNVFFAAVLPQLRAPGDLLAFLWAARTVQGQRGEARFITADAIWANEEARPAFEAFGGGRGGLDSGLAHCAEVGALLRLDLSGPGDGETVYFMNDPGSRRAVARARGGELVLSPGAKVRPVEAPARPGIFRLYEENIGTITPLIGERLIEAEQTYPPEWVESAFREAVELNRRSWRYVERILKNWLEEGRANEATGRDSFEARRDRYLGGALGHLGTRR